MVISRPRSCRRLLDHADLPYRHGYVRELARGQRCQFYIPVVSWDECARYLGRAVLYLHRVRTILETYWILESEYPAGRPFYEFPIRTRVRRRRTVHDLPVRADPRLYFQKDTLALLPTVRSSALRLHLVPGLGPRPQPRLPAHLLLLTHHRTDT